jgi:hypothetical protein
VLGESPYTWKLQLGKLPKRLKLNKRTGVISGMPKKSARPGNFRQINTFTDIWDA